MIRRLLPVFLLVILSAGAAPAASKPNILFVLSDDHSYPFLSTYGDTNVRTPTLDQLAAEGMKFHRFFTSAPQCVPSRASYLSGRSPVAARITRFSSPLPRDVVTFPEVLKAQAGYFTGVCGRSFHLDGPGGANASATAQRLLVDLGMRTFPSRLDYVKTGSDTAAIEQMGEFLSQKPADRPFCLWVNFSDPHHPWTPEAADRPDPQSLKLRPEWPDSAGLREQLADYCGEVNRLDRTMRRLLDLLAARGFAQNTIVIFAGDNGLAFPHGKGSLYDPGCQVPLVIRWPGVIKPGSESRALLSNEDLAPTLLAAAGLEAAPGMTGQNFVALLRGEAFTPRPNVFMERGPHGSAPVTVNMKNNGYDLSRAVRSERYKLIYNCTPWIPYAPVDSAGGAAWREMTAAHEAGKLSAGLSTTYFKTPRPVYELYDLESDPAELKNLSGTPALRETELALRTALAEKMIKDFDYLPLPDLGDAPAAGGGPGAGKKGGQKAKASPGQK